MKLNTLDDEIECTIWGEGVLSYKEQDHINAEHPDEEEDTIPREKEEIARPQQKKKKARMYKSARDSESDDKDEVSQEMKKIAREVGDNTNAMNDLSTSTIKHVKEIKSDMKTMSVGVKSDFIFMKEKVDNLESYVDNIAMIA